MAQNFEDKLNLGKYREVFEEAPLGIFSATMEGQYEELNNTFAFMLGYKSASDVLKKVKDISKEIYVNSADRKKIIQLVNDSEEVIHHQTNFKRADKSIFPVKISMKAIRDKKGNATRIVGIVEDISEHVNTENELVNERNQLRKLIDNIPDYIYFKNEKGQLVISNLSFTKLTANAVSTNQSIDKVAEDPSQSSVLAKLLEGDNTINNKKKEVLNKEIQLVDKETNTKQNLLVSKIPLINQKGVFKGIIGIGRDITKLKEAEKKIRESQSNLNVVLESTENAILSIGTNNNIITLNSYAINFFSQYYSKSVKPGDNFLKLFPTAIKKKWESDLKNAFKGEHVAFEYEMNYKNGFYFYECKSSPILSENHEVVGVTIFITDVTDRKCAEEALRESETRFRQLAENISDAFILSAKNKVIYANPAFEKTFGLKVKDLEKKKDLITNLIHKDDRKRFIENRTKEISKKKLYSVQHYRIIRANGEERRVWIRCYPVFNNYGKIYREIVVATDITEQSELEITLSATRTRQQAILDNIPYLAWLKDSSGKYISVNEPFAKFYGLKSAEIIGKTDYDFIPSDLADEYSKNDEAVKTSKRRKLIEKEIVTPKGKKWFETFKTPIFDENNNLIGLTGISRDITDRKMMEEAIIKNEEHFRALLQYSSDAITILDKIGQITFESSLRNRISDFTLDELIGKNFADIIHPDDKNDFKSTLEYVLKNPEEQVMKEFRSLHKNKKWIYIESIFTNHLENPSIRGIVVNSRDVSDRKMAELKERVYHDNLIFLSNSALDLLGLADREDIYKYIADKLHIFLENAVVVVTAYQEEHEKFYIKQIAGLGKYKEKVIEMLGFDLKRHGFGKNEAFHKISSAGNIIPITDEIENIDLDKKDLDTIQSIFSLLKVNKVYNITLARHNKLLGNITILTLNKTIIKFKHIIETFIHQVSVALHRSQLEYDLISAKEKAEESDMLKTAFLANMSHEIRTPMNGILGFAEMLNDENLSPGNRKKYLDIINNNGKMLISLIDDIIDFAKIEAGQIKIVKQEFSLNSLLAQVHSSFLTEILNREKSEVKLKIRKALANEDSFIKTDPNRLRQILVNLVGNAFKFTSSGYIEFGYILKNEKYLEFYVEDTGIGIPKEKINIIFDRFVQADISPSRKYSGSGLGLAISRGFVELLGGTMRAESEEDKGSTFYFTLPYEKAERAIDEIQEKATPKANYNWNGKTFLIAEDDLFSFKFLEGFLRQTNAEILHAEDGQKAIDICKKNKNIDLILMDIQMPEINGLDATSTIKKFRKKLPIIAQTANAIAEEKQRCFEAGFDDFVTKPINIQELYLKIDKWIS